MAHRGKYDEISLRSSDVAELQLLRITGRCTECKHGTLLSLSAKP